jgi:diguanylate cyclase (GGDEF)-like protein
LPSNQLSIQDRVYLERVRLFFGNAIGNMISAIIGAVFIALILHSANVPLSYISVWFSFIVFFTLVTGYVEKSYANQELTTQNGSKWVYIRSLSGGLIALMYGISPFLFSQYLGMQEEMFLFIVLSAMVSIGLVGYSIMPYYYILLNLLTMTPLTFYFLYFADTTHNILALTATIWQLLVLSKGWKVSKSAINAIVLNEQLQDEIKHHEQTKEKLQQLASHDILTGIPNRSLLMENLESMVALARKNSQKIIIMFIDLDGFKDINDRHGHDAGDVLLKEIALRLKSQMRKTDTLARMGGDEFILGFMQSDEITILAERVINAIAEPILLPDRDLVQVGGSIGISVFPDDGDLIEDLIKISDNRMYISKAREKNKYTFSN